MRLQQGFATSEMGKTINLRQKNPKLTMSLLMWFKSLRREFWSKKAFAVTFRPGSAMLLTGPAATDACCRHSGGCWI